MLYEVLKPVTRGLARLAFGLEAHGTEHVPMSGPTLVVANHSSVLDPPLVGAASPRTLHFMAKAELFDVPLFGRFIHALNARPVRREGHDASALRAALKLLDEGRALLVFPEGTRGDEGVLRDGKPGAGMLAMLSGAQVVPTFIQGSGHAWPRGGKGPRLAKVRVDFGKPFAFERPVGRNKGQYTIASREMMAAIGELQDKADYARRNRGNG
jgi:1-acyl-sn-glycerol-3-phosphate acyltransferase